MQSFHFDWIQQPDTVVHQNIVANGTKKYNIKATYDSVFRLFLKSLKHVRSSHYLFVTFPIGDIEKLTRQTTGYKETVIINIKRNIRIEIRIELEEFSSADLSLTTQDGFEIAAQHLNIYHTSFNNTEQTNT